MRANRGRTTSPLRQEPLAPATSCRPHPRDVRRKEVIAFPVAGLVVGLRTGHDREGSGFLKHGLAEIDQKTLQKISAHPSGVISSGVVACRPQPNSRARARSVERETLDSPTWARQSSPLSSSVINVTQFYGASATIFRAMPKCKLRKCLASGFSSHLGCMEQNNHCCVCVTG